MNTSLLSLMGQLSKSALLLSVLAFAGFVPISSFAAVDLQVSLEASKEVAEPEENVAFRVRVKNEGSTDAEEAIVLLTLDEDFEFVSASSDGDDRRQNVEWEDLMIPAGASREFTAVAKVVENAENKDTLRVTALADGSFEEVEVRVEDDEDRNNDNNRDVRIELLSDKGAVEPDEAFTYTVRLINDDERRKVNDIDVILELAEHVECLSSSNQGSCSATEIRWDNVDLFDDETRIFTASVRATSAAEHGETLRSTVYAEGTVMEHTLRVSDPAYGREEVRLHAYVSDDKVEPTGTLTYTFHVTNQEKRDREVKVYAQLDPQMTVASISEGGKQIEQKKVRWDDLFLKQNETTTLTLDITVNEEARPGRNLKLTASAGAESRQVLVDVVEPKETGSGSSLLGGLFGDEEGDEEESDNRRSRRDRDDDEEDPTLQIEVEKTADKDEVQPGSTITYAISLTNLGENTVRDIQVIDNLPQRMLSILDEGEGEVIDEGVQFNIRRLRPGDTWNTKYTVVVDNALTHGQVIATNTEVRSSQLLVSGSAQHQANVIEDLPQAGSTQDLIAKLEAENSVPDFDTTEESMLVLGDDTDETNVEDSLDESEEEKEEDSETVAGTTDETSGGIPIALWILLSIVGIAAGVFAGIKFVLPKLQENPDFQGQSPAHA